MTTFFPFGLSVFFTATAILIKGLNTEFPQTSFYGVASKGSAECELFSQVTCLDSFDAENW